MSATVPPAIVYQPGLGPYAPTYKLPEAPRVRRRQHRAMLDLNVNAKLLLSDVRTIRERWAMFRVLFPAPYTPRPFYDREVERLAADRVEISSATIASIVRNETWVEDAIRPRQTLSPLDAAAVVTSRHPCGRMPQKAGPLLAIARLLSDRQPHSEQSLRVAAGRPTSCLRMAVSRLRRRYGWDIVKRGSTYQAGGLTLLTVLQDRQRHTRRSLATQFGLTQEAITTAVTRLRQRGHAIETVTGRGGLQYRLGETV